MCTTPSLANNYMISKKRFTIPFPRIAVMVGQWGVPGCIFCHYYCVVLLKAIFLPGVVVVFATIYWIMGISKYISG